MKQLKSTGKQFSSMFKKILITVICWRLSLFFVLFIALTQTPLNSKNFLGGGYDIYQKNPYLFAWANFDGEHYLSIAQTGYGNLNHSFFPLYPLLIKTLSLGSEDLSLLVLAGLLISNLSLLMAIYLLYKLVNLDYSKNIAFLTLILLLVFPTSFYFGSIYTESLFLLLTVGSFYFARKSNWGISAIFGLLASATRITGIILLPALLVEWYLQSKKLKDLIWIWLIPLGLFSYMLYLYLTTGDPFSFYTELSNFGEQRSGQLVLLPQVFYRYLNILLTPNLNLLTIWTTSVELSSAIFALTLLLAEVFKKVRLSYLLYTFLAFLAPTFTGSFSSVPRYIIVLFPFFIILGMVLSSYSKFTRCIIYIALIILLVLESTLFLRGYWVA